ncbi:hypothetical protein KCU78_g3615, partial [Aureobasidium melanogenum]
MFTQTTNNGISIESILSRSNQPTLSIEPSVSNIVSTNVVDPLPTMVQSAGPSIVLPESNTLLNSIDTSVTSAGSLASANLPGPLSLPTAIVQISAADGSTSDVPTYAGSTPTPDVPSSTYAYNVNPVSTIATQNIGQSSSLVSSDSNTLPDQMPAQQTSVDSTSQLPEAASSMDSMGVTITTSSSYVQEATSIDGSASPSSQPATDENVTSSQSVSTPEASSTTATSSEPTMTQYPEQAASTSDTAPAPTTLTFDAQSTPTTLDTSSDSELDQGRATSTSVADTNSNSGSSTTVEDTSVASTTSSILQETTSATLGLSLSELLPSDSIFSTATEIEVTIAPSEPASLVPQSNLAGVETISDAATYSIVSPSLAALDSTLIDPVLVSASADGVINSAPTSVTSPDLVAPTSGSLVVSSDGEAITTSTPSPVVSLSDQLSDSEKSTSQESLSSSVPVVGPVLNLLSSVTSSVILPSETSINAVQTSSVDGFAESFVIPDILPTTATDIVIPSTTEIPSYDSQPTPDVGSISSEIEASTSFGLSNRPSQVLSTEAAAASSYAIDAGAVPTSATQIESALTDLPVDPETVASETGIALPAPETQAALPTTSLESLDSLLSGVVSGAQTVDVAQPLQSALESSISSGADQASAPLSAGVSIPTESILGTDLESSTISELVIPSSDMQQTEDIASDPSLDIITTVSDLTTDGSETSVLIPTSVIVNLQVPSITTSADELTTAIPGSSVDNLLAGLTSLESQSLPTSTSVDDISGVAGATATSIVDDTGDLIPTGASSIVPILTNVAPSVVSEAKSAATSLIDSTGDVAPSLVSSIASTASDVVASVGSDAGLAATSIIDNTGDVVSAVVSDLPAANSDILGDVTDFPAAASSIVNGDLSNDFPQPTELTSSIIDGVTTDLPAAASSIIHGSDPSVISDVGAAATSLVNIVSDLPAAAFSTVDGIPDLPAAASSILSEALPSDFSQPTGLVSSIIDGVTIDLPAAVSSTIHGNVPSIASDAGAAATSLVDNTGDVASPVVSDFFAAPSSILSDATDLPTAASSIINEALPSDFVQPTELVSSIIDGITTDLPLATDLPPAASSVIDDGPVPTFVSDAGVAASSVVDNTGDLVSSIISSVDPVATQIVSVVTDTGAAVTSVVDSVGDAASYIVSSIEPTITKNVPSVISNAGSAATSVVDNTGDAASSIIFSIDPIVSDVLPSIISADGGSSITTSVDGNPVTSSGIELTQITETLVQITSVSGTSDLTTIAPTTLIDDTLTTSIATLDAAESEITLEPTSIDLSAPSLISGVPDPSGDLPQQTNEIGSVPSYSVDPSDPATSEILSLTASDVTMATSDLAPSATNDLSVMLPSEAITSTDLLSAVESTAQVTNIDVSATAPVVAEPTYSQVGSITTGLDAAAPSTALDSDIPTDMFDIESTASASVPSASDLVSLGDGSITDLPIIPSSTTLEATNVVDPSVIAELSSSIESNVPQSDLDAASDILSSVSSMVETLLTSAVDIVPSSTDLGSEASITESGAILTASASISSQALETLTTIAGGDGPMSSLIEELATMTEGSDLLSTPVISAVPDESASTDVASITPISSDLTPTSTMLEVSSSELAPISSTLDEVLDSATSIDPSLIAVQSSTDIPIQTTDISPSDLISTDIPTGPSQVEELIPSSTTMDITSISEMPNESFPTAAPESSEPMLTAIGAASTLAEATATLASDSSFYTDLLSSTQLSPTGITVPTTSVSVDLGVTPEPEEATSTSDIPSLSVTDSVESIATLAADLDQSATSLSDILSGLPTEIETMGPSATAALTDPSVAPSESILSTSATMPDVESNLPEAIDSMTSTLDASVTFPTASSDIPVSTFALGAAQSETLVPLPTEASDDRSQPIESTSIGSIETDAVAPSIVTSNDIISSPVTTEAPSSSTSAIDDLLDSDTDMAGVTSVFDSASPSTAIESFDPESVISSSELAEVQSTTMPLVGSDVPSPSAIDTDALPSLVETATSQIEAISSTLGYNSIATSSEILASATDTALVDSSGIETITSDILGGLTTLLPSDSQSLPTSTLDFGVPVSGLPTDIVTFTDPTDAVSSPLSSSIIDDESSFSTSLLTQPTDISDIPISTDDQSEASASFTMDINATSDSITVLPPVTDAPTIATSDPLASIITAPESSVTSYPDTASIVPDAASTIASMADSSSVDLGSLPTSEIFDSAGSLSATSVLQDASSAIAYVDSSTTDLDSLPTSDIADVAGSSSTTLIVPDVSSAMTNSSIVDIGPLPTDVADVTSLPSVTTSSNNWSDISASVSAIIETTLDTPTPSVMDDLPSSTLLTSITPAPDLSETSLLDTSSVIEEASSAMPSWVGDSAIDSESQPTGIITQAPDSSSSMTSFDALSEVAASLAVSTEEIQEPTTMPSSTVDLSSITSSDPLPWAAATSEAGEISSLDTTSTILNPSSLAQSTIGSLNINPGPELTSAFAEITDLPSASSTVDSESFPPTSILTQTTDTPLITSDPDIQSETLSSTDVTSDYITDESMVSSATSVLSSVISEIMPLTTDLPSSTFSDLSALTTVASEPLETGSDPVDIDSSTQDVSSMFSIASSSGIVVSKSIPASAISEATNVPSITLDSQSETSTLPVTPSESISEVSVLSPTTDVPSSPVSASAADSASSLIDTISASIVLGAADASSSLIDSDMATPASVLTQATGLSDIFTSSATQSDISTSFDPTTETALSIDATALPSSLTSSLNSEVLSSLTTSLVSMEGTATSVDVSGASTDISSLTQDYASMIASISSETEYSASAATGLPVSALSSSPESGVGASTSITAAVSGETPLASSVALSTISAESELLSSVTTVQPTDLSVSIGLGYASSSELPATSQLTSSEEATSTIISGLPTEIQTVGPSDAAAMTSSVVSIPNVLSQSLGPDTTETSSSLMSVVDNTTSTSAIIQISADSDLSTPTSPLTLSSFIAPLETSVSVEAASSSAVNLSPVNVPTDTPVAVANMTSLSSGSKLEPAVATSAAVTSQTLLDTTLASIDSTLAASAVQALTSSTIIDSPATPLPSSFTASSGSVVTMNSSQVSDTVLPAQTLFGAASSSASGTLSTVVQTSDIVSQSASLVAPPSNIIQISSTTSSQSDNLISSILQVVSSDAQSASSIALSSNQLSTYDPASGAGSSTMVTESTQTAISSSLPATSGVQTLASSVISISGSISATSVISPSAGVSNSISVSQLSLSASIAAPSISLDLGLFSSVSSESSSGIVPSLISSQSSSSVALPITSSTSVAVSSLLMSSMQSTAANLISTGSILQSASSSAIPSSATNIGVESTSMSILPGLGTAPTPSSLASLQSSSTATSAISSISSLPAASSSTTDTIDGGTGVCTAVLEHFAVVEYSVRVEHFAILKSTGLGHSVGVKHSTVVEHFERSIDFNHLADIEHCVTFEHFAVLESTLNLDGLDINEYLAINEHLAIFEHSAVFEVAVLGQFANFKCFTIVKRAAVVEHFEHSIIVEHPAFLECLIIKHRIVVQQLAIVKHFDSSSSIVSTSVASSVSSSSLSVPSLSISSANLAAAAATSSSSTSVSTLLSSSQVIEASVSAPGLGASSVSSPINIGASVSSSAASSTGTTQSLVSQSSPSSLSSVSSLGLPLSIAVPTPSISTSQTISSQANAASSSTNSNIIPSTSSSSTMISSSSSTISAVSSSTTTGYLINVGVGSTSVGVIQTAGGGNLVDVAAGSVASTQISASAANPITTAVGSVIGSSGIGTTVFIEPKCFVCHDCRVVEHIRIHSQLFYHQHIFNYRKHTAGWYWKQFTRNVSDFLNPYERYISCGFSHSIAKRLLRRRAQQSEFVHCYHFVIALKFRRGCWCYKCTFHASGVVRYIWLSKRINSSGAVKQPVNSDRCIDVKQYIIEHFDCDHSSVVSVVTPSVQIGVGLSSQTFSSSSAASIQPYIGFGPVGQLVKPGLFLFGINVLALKYWVWYNISCSGEQQSLEYFDSSNNAGQLKYWDHDNTSCPSEHQSIESDFFIFNTAAIGVATNVLPASQSTLTSSSAGSSTVPSVVSTSASSVTPTSVVPSTIASSASSSASSSAGSSIVATSSTINSNTGIVASSTSKSSSTSSSTPVTSILAATSNLAVSLSSPSVLSSVSSQCCTFVIERASVIYDFNKLKPCSVRFFVKSSRLFVQLDHSIVKCHTRDEYFSSVIHEHFEDLTYCFEYHKLLSGIIRHVKSHHHFGSINIKCYLHYYQL